MASTPRPRRLTPVVLAAAIVTTSVLVAPVAGPASPAGAQQGTATTEVPAGDGSSSVGDILPRPDSGQAPDSPNDPGGWQQYMVFALIGAGLAVIFALATRESRRIRRAQGRYP